MGLLESMMGNVAGSLLGGGASGAGGGQGQLVQVLLSMLTQGGGGGQAGGLGELIGRLNQAGLGDVASSWVGTGANLPISADQLSQVLGPDTLGALAGQLGMDPGSATSQLSELLPGVVDALTPQGRLPEAGSDLSGLATQVLGRFLQG